MGPFAGAVEGNLPLTSRAGLGWIWETAAGRSENLAQSRRLLVGVEVARPPGASLEPCARVDRRSTPPSFFCFADNGEWRPTAAN